MEDYEVIRRELLRQREELRTRVAAIAADVGHASRPLDPDFEEQAVERQGDEVLNALDVAARRELDQIERALERIDRGEYGICSECGNYIPIERLRVLPHTDRCVRCAGKSK